MEKKKKDLVPKVEETIDELKQPMQIAQVFVESGMFKDIKTQSQAVVKILAGKEMGLSPFEAMNNLYIVNDKVGIMSNAMASIVKKSKKYDYNVKLLTDTECVIEFFSLNGEQKLLGESSFTFKDAAKAGLVNKEVWKSYPRNMLFARALSNGVRFYCPDASYGYCVEELRDVDVVPVQKTIELTEEGKVKEVDNGQT